MDIEKAIQRVPKSFPFIKDIQDKINDPHERDQATRAISNIRCTLTQNIATDPLFFVS